MVKSRKSAKNTTATTNRSERSLANYNEQNFSWSKLAQARLKQSILWPYEQINIFWSKFSDDARSALAKKNGDIKLASWFDVASGLVAGGLTVDLPVTLLMMATTSAIYGNNLSTSPQGFILTVAAEVMKSACISSLNFGLRNMLRKGENGNLIGGLVGGALDRHFRQLSSSTSTLFMGALNGATYEVFRPDINNQKRLINSIVIYGLIEGVDSCLSNLATGGEPSKILKSIATSILLGVYLATCVSKLTIPYSKTITTPLVAYKDKALKLFSSYAARLQTPQQAYAQAH